MPYKVFAIENGDSDLLDDVTSVGVRRAAESVLSDQYDVTTHLSDDHRFPGICVPAEEADDLPWEMGVEVGDGFERVPIHRIDEGWEHITSENVGSIERTTRVGEDGDDKNPDQHDD